MIQSDEVRVEALKKLTEQDISSVDAMNLITDTLGSLAEVDQLINRLRDGYSLEECVVDDITDGDYYILIKEGEEDIEI